MTIIKKYEDFLMQLRRTLKSVVISVLCVTMYIIYIYLQLCMLDDHHIFLIASLHIVTKLLLDEIYHIREVTFEGLSMEC